MNKKQTMFTNNISWVRSSVDKRPLLPKHMRKNIKHTYIHTHTYIHIHIHTYIHTYMHAYIHTYIHAYMHPMTHTSAAVSVSVDDESESALELHHDCISGVARYISPSITASLDGTTILVPKVVVWLA